MKLRFLALAPFLFAAACDVQPPVKITSEPAAVSFVSGAPDGRIRQDRTETVVRAYKSAQTEDGKATRLEVAGARCTLTSDHIRAEVITPQAVQLPKYDQQAKLEDRGVPPSVLVKCKADKLEGQALLAAKPGQIISGSGNLVVDLVLIAGSAAAAATADWQYEPAIGVTVQ